MVYFKIFLTITLSIVISVGFAQGTKKCGTVSYNDSINKTLNNRITNSDFEKWLSKKIEKRRSLRSQQRTEEEIYKIPLVFHIIHNGEEIGVNSNIPLNQIEAQIKSLNEDFRRTNADANRTPDAFKSVAADCEIEFVLALQDPDGAPTTGILRVNGKKEQWTMDEGNDMKKLSYWPSDQYLNVWVCNLGGNIFGYSQFPTSYILPGLEEGSDIAETDGVVINYKEFGRGGNASRRSRGRTVTHEIGHFLGLKHIWGDDAGGCSGEDFVNDTPNQGDANNKCVSYPSSTCGNSSDMFMNFMDYTPDTCMNIFTNGQKERMRAILENSPRRTILLTSKALSAPVKLSLDAAIIKIITPSTSICENTLTPSFILRNLGTSTLKEITIEYQLDNLTPVTISRSFSIKSYDTAKLILPEIPLSNKSHTLSITLSKPNGGTDERSDNNSMSVSFYHPPIASVPLNEPLDNLDQFIVKNPDNGATWQIANAPGSGVDNKAAFIDFFNSPTKTGENDFLLTPAFSASGMDSLSLSFKYAYRKRFENSTDALIVQISHNCGRTWEEAAYYTGDGLETNTIPDATSPFVPSGPGDWGTTCINLFNYAGYHNLQVAFIASNGSGNNLYIDDIEIKHGNCNFGYPVANEPDNAANSQLKIYPNPNNGGMFLDMELSSTDNLEILVIDPLGKILHKEKTGRVNTLHHRLELTNVSPGIHFIKIKGNKINLNKKIIIRR